MADRTNLMIRETIGRRVLGGRTAAGQQCTTFESVLCCRFRPAGMQRARGAADGPPRHRRGQPSDTMESGGEAPIGALPDVGWTLGE